MKTGGKLNTAGQNQGKQHKKGGKKSTDNTQDSVISKVKQEMNGNAEHEGI